VNVDTDTFAAIQEQVDGLSADLAQTELHLAQTVGMVARLLQDLMPAVVHATGLERQPRPRGRHRPDRGRQSRDSRLPHCREGET
jgi:hypothetical protein